jgi:hypothetical protein
VSRERVFLDYGTRKLHLVAAGEEAASWPASACGINRELGRPEIFTEQADFAASEVCKRCLRAPQKEEG